MTQIGRLFDRIVTEFGLRTDAALAEKLEMEPANFSRLRTGRRPITAEVVLKMHDLTGWPVGEIKGALGQPCMPLCDLRQKPH